MDETFDRRNYQAVDLNNLPALFGLSRLWKIINNQLGLKLENSNENNASDDSDYSGSTTEDDNSITDVVRENISPEGSTSNALSSNKLDPKFEEKNNSDNSGRTTPELGRSDDEIGQDLNNFRR